MSAMAIIIKDIEFRIEELIEENAFRAIRMRDNEIKIAALKEQLAYMKNPGFVCKKEDIHAV